MALPMVVIVGRPNVGKSSLLNSLARARISIVDPRAGITRDRVSFILEHEDRYFEMIDTGGVGIIDDDRLEEHVEDQIRFALAAADVILFVVDARDGVTALDVRVAEMLRPLAKPAVLIANKVDSAKIAPSAGELNKLGFGEPILASAMQGFGRDEIFERIHAILGDHECEPPAAPVMKLAIVGKRNAGKSTFVNALAGEERMIVSETPGTTRDSVDVRFERDGRVFVAIDTAGVRKRSSMDDIDFYSYTRALRSIRRADVVLHMIDAEVPISEVDLKLAGAVLDEAKPVLLVINKWDLAIGRSDASAFGAYLSQVMPMLDYAPMAFVTAKTGKNVQAAVDVALSLNKQASARLTTSQLNTVLEQILAERGPSAKRGTKRVKVYYATQVSSSPPTIVFFCNAAQLVSDNYRRYMENRLRELTPFREIPLRLLFRSSGSGIRRGGSGASASQSEVSETVGEEE